MARLAGSLVTLRDEVNRAYPGRSKASDGWIGDTAHQSRKSDHNPDGQGVVRAIDVTEWDPHTPSVDLDDVAEALAEFLRAKKDPRVKYVIWRGRMFSSYKSGKHAAWTWRPYTGANGHFIHVHVSCQPGNIGDDDRAWGFKKPGAKKYIDIGDRGKNVQFLEEVLNLVWEFRVTSRGTRGGAQLPANGVWETRDREATREFQRFCNQFLEMVGQLPLMAVDGIPGPHTLKALGDWAQVAMARK